MSERALLTDNDGVNSTRGSAPTYSTPRPDSRFTYGTPCPRRPAGPRPLRPSPLRVPSDAPDWKEISISEPQDVTETRTSTFRDAESLPSADAQSPHNVPIQNAFVWTHEVDAGVRLAGEGSQRADSPEPTEREWQDSNPNYTLPPPYAPYR